MRWSFIRMNLMKSPRKKKKKKDSVNLKMILKMSSDFYFIFFLSFFWGFGVLALALIEAIPLYALFIKFNLIITLII